VVYAKADKQRQLLKKFNEATARDSIRIVGLHQLIADAYSTHMEAIATINHDLSQEDDEAEESETDEEEAA
jgi:hypothetical protein